jgi:hypothetical protein
LRDVAARRRRNGGDPLKDKRTLRQAKTVNDLLDEYLASPDFSEKAPSTQAIDRGRIERHLRPLFRKRHVHLLTDQDIKRGLIAIRDGKTAADIKTVSRGRARVRGGPGTARMAIELLRVVFNWARVNPNPCDGIKTGSSGTRETILDDATITRDCLKPSTRWSANSAFASLWPM